MPTRPVTTASAIGYRAGRILRRLGLGAAGAAAARAALRRLAPGHPALRSDPSGPNGQAPRSTTHPLGGPVPGGYAQGRADLQLTHRPRRPR